MTLEEIMVIGMFATFIVLLMTGYPVAWVLAGTGVIFAVIGTILVENFTTDLWFSWSSSMELVPERIWGIISSETLVALPMFIFMGVMLDHSGVAERLMNNVVKLFGGLRGGYAITVIFIGVLLAASTGIVGASVVLLGMLSLPVMMKNNYSKTFAVGTACSVGTLGILIPPSIMLVLMADQLANPNASVGDLFMGAFLPGFLLASLYVAYVLIISWLKPEVAPAGKTEPVTFRLIIDVIIAIVPTAFLILSVLGSIFLGVATPTEASAVGATGAIILALFNKRLSVKTMQESLIQTSKTTAFIFAIFIGATTFSVVLRGLGGDEVIEQTILSFDLAPMLVLLLILSVVFMLGFFLDWVEITLIILPLIAPIIEGLGFNLVWFTILFAICLQTSFITPPVGFSLFYIKGVCPPEISIVDIYKGVLPYILLQLLAITIVIMWPPIVTWLPSIAY